MDGEVGGTPRPTSKQDAGLLSRLGGVLASPIGVMSVVPILVGVVGLWLLWIGQLALRQTSLSMAQERLESQMGATNQRLAQALDQAEPVLLRLKDWSLQRDTEELREELPAALRDLVAGRPGMTQAYMAFPDGLFLGIYWSADQQLRFQVSEWHETRAQIQHFSYGVGGLLKVEEEWADYDPRERAWYQLGTQAGQMAWTKPYPFFTTGSTGVTAVQPVYREGTHKQLHAVVGVDFDVSALSAFIRDADEEGVYSLVFEEDGTLLAYSRGSERMKKKQPADRALVYSDLDSPLLNAFFSSWKEGSQTKEGEWFELTVQGHRVLAKVERGQSTGKPGWYLASLADERVFLGALRHYQVRSIGFASAALLLSLLISWLFARHVVQVRAEVVRVRQEAETATRRVNELGSYRLIGRIGKGGMGEVWRARHRLLAREAAIKLIAPDHHRSVSLEEMRERFKREAQSIAALRSRHTVVLYDYGVTKDGTFFYVMELLEGIDLEHLVERYGKQPWGRVIDILVQACYSLAEAHQAGLVHRDIKPANLFLCRAADEMDLIKVLDFGLVSTPLTMEEAETVEAERAQLSPEQEAERLREQATDEEGTESSAGGSARLTRAGNQLGTPAFIAPEQALDHPVDGRADIYSLACVGLWLLTGELPFPGTTGLAMMLAHMQKPPEELPIFQSGELPAELQEVLLSCLAKDPNERPNSARELAQKLRQITLPEAQRFSEEERERWWADYLPDSSGETLETRKTLLIESSEG